MDGFHSSHSHHLGSHFRPYKLACNLVGLVRKRKHTIDGLIHALCIESSTRDKIYPNMTFKTKGYEIPHSLCMLGLTFRGIWKSYISKDFSILSSTLKCNLYV